MKFSNTNDKVVSQLLFASLAIIVTKAILYPNSLWSKPTILIGLIGGLVFVGWQTLAIAKGAKWAKATFLVFFFIGIIDLIYHYEKLVLRFEKTPYQELTNLVCWLLNIAAAFLLLIKPSKEFNSSQLE